MATAKELEKPTQLSSRVYKVHRRMIRELGKKFSSRTHTMRDAEVVRLAIEETHAKYFGA